MPQWSEDIDAVFPTGERSSSGDVRRSQSRPSSDFARGSLHSSHRDSHHTFPLAKRRTAEPTFLSNAFRRSKAGDGLHLQRWRTLTPMTMTIVPIICFRLKSVFVVALYPVLEELNFGELDSNTATSRLQTRVLYP
jgi:hypothetical protein